MKKRKTEHQDSVAVAEEPEITPAAVAPPAADEQLDATGETTPPPALADSQKRTLIDERLSEMQTIRSEIRIDSVEYHSFAEQAKDKKKAIETKNGRILELLDEIRDIENGQFQPGLFDGKQEESMPDELQATDRYDAVQRHFANRLRDDIAVTPRTLAKAVYGEASIPFLEKALTIIQWFVKLGQLEADYANEEIDDEFKHKFRVNPLSQTQDDLDLQQDQD